MRDLPDTGAERRRKVPDPGRRIGHLDGLSEGALFGWAADTGSSEPVKLEVVIDGTRAGVVTCAEYRADLARNEINNGYAAFRFELPYRYRDGREHRIELRHRAGTGIVAGSPRTLTIDHDARSEDWSARFRAYIVKAPPTRDARRALHDTLGEGGVRRVAIMVGFTAGLDPSPATNRAIAQLKRNGYFVLHVHASTAAADARNWRVVSNADAYFLKYNVGYDFGSWLSGLALIWRYRSTLDEILFINDSNLGPVHKLAPALDPAHLESFDIFGLIDNYDMGYHLQSYFLRFSRRVIESGFLPHFASQYPITADKTLIVKHGEVGLSRLARDHGLRLGSLADTDSVRRAWLERCDTYRSEAIRAICGTGYSAAAEETFSRFEDIKRNAVDGLALNPTHYYWRALFEEFAFPFVKRDLILKNPVAIPDWHMIPSVLSTRNEAYGRWVVEMTRDNGGLVPMAALPFSGGHGPATPARSLTEALSDE